VISVDPSDAEPAPLLERGYELASLAARADATRRGEGALAVIAGAAGTGKSTLLARVMRYARESGLTVCRGRGSELEQDLPFGLMRQLLEPLVAAAPPEHQAQLFADAAAGARRLVLDSPMAGDSVGGDDFATLHALFWLVAGIAAETSVLLAVDDLHWADAPSVRALNYLAGRVAELPVLIVVALRPGESTGVADLIRPLHSSPGAQRLELTALGAESVASLVRASIPDAGDELCDAFSEASGGNPFYLRELVRTLTAGGARPEAAEVRAAALIGVGDHLLARLRSLGPAAPKLAMAMAVMGASGRLDHAAAVAGLGHDTAAEAALAMRRVEILAREDPFEWIHPLVRRSLYDGLSVTHRDALHTRAAEVLMDAGAMPGVVAAHLAALRPSGSTAVVEGLLAAVDEALSRNAPDVAVDLLGRALAEDTRQRFTLLLQLGAIEVSRRSPAAIEVLREAHELADDPRERALVALRLGEILTHVGYYQEAVSMICDGLAELDGSDPDLTLEMEVARAVSFAFDPALAPQLWKDRPRLHVLAERDAWPARALSALLALTYAFRGERLSEIPTLCEQALQGGRLLAERGAGAWTPAHVIGALTTVEAYDRALAVADVVEAAARSQGAVSNVLLADGVRGDVVGRRGDLAGAEEILRSLAETSQSIGWLLGLITALWWMGDVILERAANDDLADLLDSFEVPPGFEAVAPGAWALVIRGRVRASRGRRDEAVEDLRAAGAVFDGLGFGVLHDPWRSDLALVLPTSEREEARALVAEELRQAAATGFARPRAVALHASGLLTAGDAGIELLEESAMLLAASPARYHLARAQVDLGAALRRSGRVTDARESLRAGMELSFACGADRLVTRAREELLAAGARPRRIVRSGFGALTGSERRVVRLAMEGRSNPEIAQALFLSVKTIETHLSNAYAKLGLSGAGARRRLAAFVEKDDADRRA
jgi:DNA-binding CsgD family transcriptional regulator